MNQSSTRADAGSWPAVDAAFGRQPQPEQQLAGLRGRRLILACAGLLTFILGLGVYVLEGCQALSHRHGLALGEEPRVGS